MTPYEFLARAEWFKARNGYYPTRIKLSPPAFIRLAQSAKEEFGVWLGQLCGIRVTCRGDQ